MTWSWASLIGKQKNFLNLFSKKAEERNWRHLRDWRSSSLRLDNRSSSCTCLGFHIFLFFSPFFFMRIASFFMLLMEQIFHLNEIWLSHFSTSHDYPFVYCHPLQTFLCFGSMSLRSFVGTEQLYAWKSKNSIIYFSYLFHLFAFQ